MVALRLWTRRAASKRVVALVCVLALVLGASLVSLGPCSRRGRRARAGAPRAGAPARLRGAAVAPLRSPRLRARPGAVLLPAAEWSDCGQGFECSWLKSDRLRRAQRRAAPRHRPAQGPGGRSPEARRLAGWSTRAARALLAPITPRRRAWVATRDELRHRRVRPPGDRPQQPGGLPHRPRARRLPGQRTRSRTPVEEQEFMGWVDRIGSGCAERSETCRPRQHRGGGPRHGRAPRRPGESPLRLRRLLRHQAGRDLRRALPGPREHRSSTGPWTSQQAKIHNCKAAGRKAIRSLRPDPWSTTEPSSATRRPFPGQDSSTTSTPSRCQPPETATWPCACVAPLYTRSYWLLLSAAWSTATATP